jgi:hypothetical protein
MSIMLDYAPASHRPRRIGLPLLLAAIAALSPGAFAAEGEVIGSAEQLKPEAGARLQGEARTLAVGAELHRDEQVWTSSGGRLDIKFADGSSVTMGENARMVLDEFVLPEGATAGSQVIRSITGALRFVGGAVDQSKPGATKIVTPIATMTVRGTEFFAGPIDGAYGVFVFHGRVDVATSAGSVSLTDGEGTSLTASGVAPTPPKTWGAAKIARAEKLVGY